MRYSADRLAPATGKQAPAEAINGGREALDRQSCQSELRACSSSESSLRRSAATPRIGRRPADMPLRTWRVKSTECRLGRRAVEQIQTSQAWANEHPQLEDDRHDQRVDARPDHHEYDRWCAVMCVEMRDGLQRGEHRGRNCHRRCGGHARSPLCRPESGACDNEDRERDQTDRCEDRSRQRAGRTLRIRFCCRHRRKKAMSDRVGETPEEHADCYRPDQGQRASTTLHDHQLSFPATNRRVREQRSRRLKYDRFWANAGLNERRIRPTCHGQFSGYDHRRCALACRSKCRCPTPHSCHGLAADRSELGSRPHARCRRHREILARRGTQHGVATSHGVLGVSSVVDRCRRQQNSWATRPRTAERARCSEVDGARRPDRRRCTLSGS